MGRKAETTGAILGTAVYILLSIGLPVVSMGNHFRYVQPARMFRLLDVATINPVILTYHLFLYFSLFGLK